MNEFEREMVKAQCRAFTDIGATHSKLRETRDKLNPHLAMIVHNNKMYRFSDPDANVIIAQLAQLYKVIKNGQMATTYARNI